MGADSVVTFPEAERRLRGLPTAVGAEWADLAGAVGRIAAEDVRAPGDLPRLPRSAMDGYAVPAGSGPETALRLAGTLYAGDPPGEPLDAGQCLAVATGAALPPGTAAVVAREWARTDGATVHLRRAPAPRENVVDPGEEARQGTPLLAAGTRVGPRHIAALAAYGLARLRVRQPLRVAVLATGDEVVEAGRQARPEQVYESGTPALEAAMRATGIDVDRSAPCPDQPDALTARFQALLSAGSQHAVVTTGGVSAGDRDLVPAAWEHLGADRVFWRVAAKPGGAMYVARAETMWLFSLSGNPHAALAGFYSLVRAALADLAGLSLGDRVSGSLAGPCETRRERHRLVWAEGFRPLVGLSTLETLVRADTLLLVPPGDTPLPAGGRVDGVRLDVGP